MNNRFMSSNNMSMSDTAFVSCANADSFSVSASAKSFNIALISDAIIVASFIICALIIVCSIITVLSVAILIAVAVLIIAAAAELIIVSRISPKKRKSLS